MYYIISLCHTSKHEQYLTLWRPNNAGYCYSKEQAGVYESPEKGYHDSDSNMPIKVEEADKLFQHLPYDNVMKYMIPNTREVWKSLNVKMTKHGLVKS
ncbi:hypothetical protein V6R21_06390 [Limibacter armeniacum]|uniref:hypothetical protein n=1 Tax=Limibacter armeniacum TaxID=466084 RepID=UPI002FE678B7